MMGCLLTPPFPEMSKQTLHTLYMFAGNIGQVISYEKLREVAPSYDYIPNIRVVISNLRHTLSPYGLDIVSVRGVGYKCVKAEMVSFVVVEESR